MGSRAVVMTSPVTGETTRTAESAHDANILRGTLGCVVLVRKWTLFPVSAVCL